LFDFQHFVEINGFEVFENIKIIGEKTKVTKAIAVKLAKYANLTMGRNTPKDWYCLLRHCQGSLHHVLHSGFLKNAVDENEKPHFEEFGYILNFDNDTFEFYDHSDKAQIIPLSKLEGLLEKWQGYKMTAAQRNYDPEFEFEKSRLQQGSMFHQMYGNIARGNLALREHLSKLNPTTEDIAKFFSESDEEESEEEDQGINNTKSSIDNLDYAKTLCEPNYKRKVSLNIKSKTLVSDEKK